jgi:hypothetical protein
MTDSPTAVAARSQDPAVAVPALEVVALAWPRDRRAMTCRPSTEGISGGRLVPCIT